jgi:hypothetical protein
VFSTISDNFWDQEALQFIPITKFSFNSERIDLNESLDHGFPDVKNFFPTWRDFLTRSTGKNPNYSNYMTFLLVKPNIISDSQKNLVYKKQIIGVLAVQLLKYDKLEDRNMATSDNIDNYLYLSWIALDQKYQSYNYFSLLFEYYNSLIRRFRKILKTNIEGIAIIIRRMREVIWGLFNDNEKCPENTDREFTKKSARFDITFIPYEIFDPLFQPIQDHILITIKKRD